MKSSNAATTVLESSDQKERAEQQEKEAEKKRAEELKRKKQKEAQLKKEQEEYLKEANQVVVTPRGKKYHYPSCRTVRGSYKTLTIKQARKRGYKPCGVCSPPASEVTIENSNIYWGDNYYGKEK